MASLTDIIKKVVLGVALVSNLDAIVPAAPDAPKQDYSISDSSKQKYSLSDLIQATQNKSISHYNKKQLVMLSAPQLYDIAKSAPNEILTQLQGDFKKGVFFTGTLVKYKQGTYDAEMSHNQGSTVAKPIKKKLIVPSYVETTLSRVLSKKEGVDYLQALFNTTDNEQTILTTLEKLTGTNAQDIIIWTAMDGDRKGSPCLVFGLRYDDNRFIMSTTSTPDKRAGYSRGMKK